MLERAIEKEELGAIVKAAMYSYIGYVALERAIPDIRDGFINSERHCICGMFYSGNTYDNAFRKSAKAVGVIMGEFHPHGDSSIYGTIIKLAQPWKVNIPYMLIDGNKGSITGEPPAAFRYTETKLSRIAELIFKDLKVSDVDADNKNAPIYVTEHRDNFDGSIKEPCVLPSHLPSLLINGAKAVGVGYKTTFLPHNATATLRACIEYNKNNKIDTEALIDIIIAPDFPSGGVVVGGESLRDLYRTGIGSVVVRGKVDVIPEVKSSRDGAVLNITALPPEVDNDKFIEAVNKLQASGDISLRGGGAADYTDGNGINIRLTLKKDEDSGRVVNLLLNKTPFQQKIHVKQIALVDRIPTNVNLRTMISKFVEFREEIVYNRSIIQLGKLKKSLHLTEGLLLVYLNLDAVIKVIRGSNDSDEDLNKELCRKFKLSTIQADNILEMRLKKIKNIEKIAVEVKIKKLLSEIKTMAMVTNTRKNKHITTIIDGEFKTAISMLDKTDVNRKCDISYDIATISEIDSVKLEDRMITLTASGRIKVSSDIDRTESSRNTSGGKQIDNNGEDLPVSVLHTKTNSMVYFFTDEGRVYSEYVYTIPITNKTKSPLAKNLLSLRVHEKIVTMVTVDKVVGENIDLAKYFIFTTKNGMVKISDYSGYVNIGSKGTKGIKLHDSDELMNVCLYTRPANTDIIKDDTILLTSSSGQSIRTPISDISVTGKDTSGVKGIKLRAGAQSKIETCIGGVIIDDNSKFLYITDIDGLSKKVSVDEFRPQLKDGYGVSIGGGSRDIISVICSRSDMDMLTIFSKNGNTIRINKNSFRLVGRTANGIKTIKLRSGDTVIKVTESNSK